ncbi:Fe-S cluster assembly sulfur transfer protein SufU [Humidisolicoccus flavus]|uniref:Fe-S cluster assembly sulfur transfer protein SufU n=1 Tax=Humidisolicoccus flavus TaxID=3111414 RepID=UPI003243FE19
MSGALDSLYQQLILEHSKRRVGEGSLDHADASHHELNPSCGDEITVEVRLHDGRIAALAWQGAGCSISMASASVLSELAAEESLEEFTRQLDAFRAMLQSRGAGTPDEAVLGDGIAFHGVSKYIMRVKCAMLAWIALDAATKKALAVHGTDSGSTNA